MNKLLRPVLLSALWTLTAVSASAQDYEGKAWFTKIWPVVSGPTLTMMDRLKEGGRMDAERFVNSGQGAAFMESYALQRQYTLGTEPGVIQYWDDKGIKKVDHNEDPLTRWIAYVPKEALDPNNKKTFPLIFNLPHSNLFETEGRGYAELAAKERVIVVLPSVVNIEDIMATYIKAVKTYPVDTSRFYMAGFSFTSFRTLEFALRHPEILAAININSHLWPFGWQLPKKWITDHSAQLKMPIVMQVGNGDFGIPLPLYKSMTDAHTRMGDVHLHTGQDNVDRANMWFAINGVKPITYAQSFATETSQNPVEREIGAPVSRSKVKRIDDTNYYMGDFKSEDGVYRTRFISMDNVPHMPFGSMAEVAWDFLKHFRRNIDTGATLSDDELPLN